MTKAVDVGADILQGMENALAFARGDRAKGREHVVEIPVADVRAVRAKLGCPRPAPGQAQDRFAAAFGVSARTVRKWEQGERRPTGAARVLLKVIEREPEAVRRALRG